MLGISSKMKLNQSLLCLDEVVTLTYCDYWDRLPFIQNGAVNSGNSNFGAVVLVVFWDFGVSLWLGFAGDCRAMIMNLAQESDAAHCWHDVDLQGATYGS